MGEVREETPTHQKVNAEEPTPMPFVTTSDVLKKLNQSLKELAQPGEGLEPRFELQRRLPDGSSKPASQAEMEYSDLQTKLQQSAAFVAQLQDSDKAIWAEDQRLAGNSYFSKGDYKGAMDIYLTCLVVKQDTPAFVRQTMVPVLNNLAQCTLQLAMHKKTMEFCKIALEEIEKYPQQDLLDPEKEKEAALLEYSISKCKLHFKRAKASRLTGEYSDARKYLNDASSLLSNHRSGANTSNSTIAPYQQAIQKEFRYLEASEKEARKNRQRQKKAMQQALSTPSGSKKSTASSTASTSTNTSSPLFDSQASTGPRQYSTLRARKKDTKSTSSTATPQAERSSRDLSYVQYYWMVVARVVEGLLIWLGDEETKEEVKKRAQ